MIFTVLQRIRPTRVTLAALMGLLWAITFGGIRDFVWADLKEGAISLRGLSITVRGLILLGFVLLFAMLGVLLFNDLWRGIFPLLPALSGVAGRGSLIPEALLPLTLFMFTIAWTFALAGALYSHWIVRLGVLVLYLGTGILWCLSLFVAASISATPRSLLLMGLALLGLGVILLLFAASRWLKPPPAVAFPLLLGAVALTHAVAQFESVSDLRVSGIPLVLGNIGITLALLEMLIIPLLFLIGLDIADFARQAAHWPLRIVHERLPGWVPLVSLPLLLGWRLWVAGTDLLAQLETMPLPALIFPYLGALGILLWVGLLWWLVTRTAGGAINEETIDGAVGRYALVVILGYYGIQMANVYLPGPDLILWASGAAIVGGVLLAWRGARGLGLYLALVGAIHVWSLFTELDAPLRQFYWDRSEMVEFWWVILFTLTAIWWAGRGHLTAARAERLLFLLLVVVLLRQTDFIENPFSPFFAFAGIGFIAFGIAWDVVTAGSWANVSTPGLPRTSRVFLYLGYMLITVTVINWALTAHDLATIENFTGGVAMAGLTRFGRPLLYAIFAATLAGAGSPTASTSE